MDRRLALALGGAVFLLIAGAMFASEQEPEDRFSCEEDSDCVSQRSCTCCSYSVNKEFHEEPDCEGISVRCAQVCPKNTVPKCIEGACKLVGDKI